VTTTEVDLRPASPAIPAKIAYARALAESGLLPDVYRKQPANILWAVEYGEMLGLSTMAAITGVHVIKGKPTASAGLISALVRRAGHKLRIRGDDKSATCQIIRADDPKYTFEVTFTIDDAKTAELLEKDNWKHFAAAMLKARAITQCARDACEEALFGLHYTPEELGAEVDGDGEPVTPEPPRLPAAVAAGDDPWYVRPAPEDPPAQDTAPWTVDRALEEARTFKSEADGKRVWLEAGQAALNGWCAPGQRDYIQNTVTKRIDDRRKDAAARILRPLPEDDVWRQAVQDLTGNLTDTAAARTLLDDLGTQKAAGAIDEARAKLVGRAIIAAFPNVVLKDAETVA
jgi:hypothetical protein